jgi:hypothetical protein
MTTDTAGNLYIADHYNHRIRQVLAATQKIQTVIGNGTAGFAGDGLPGRGVTITATVAGGGPNYLPVTVGVNVEQSTWNLFSFPASTTGPTFSFGVRQTSAVGSSMRMNGSTTFSVTPNTANVVSVPATLTILNNGTVPQFSISAIARASNVVTATIPAGSGLGVGQDVVVSGVSNSTFNGTFTITSATATTITYAQTAADAASTGGSVTGSVAKTLGAGSTQIIAQASATGIALGASSNISVSTVFTAVNPSSSAVKNTAIPVVITGRNLLNATGITGPSGITATINSVSADGQTMNASITVGTSVPAGAQTLTILTPTGNVTFTFTVN